MTQYSLVRAEALVVLYCVDTNACQNGRNLNVRISHAVRIFLIMRQQGTSQLIVKERALHLYEKKKYLPDHCSPSFGLQPTADLQLKQIVPIFSGYVTPSSFHSS
ncbi:unnamed protein product [Albugo candida]|uniref:Uncharacterized protein n=1 Tax=Albugo candida TaxID=65357 RepID=A0A024GT09_9STRA|nr:unnamed protein product [Albugo candida]|eukprot:CCI50071.1 unnamed protein product [Albugo candida]